MLIMTLGITVIDTFNNNKLNKDGIPFGALIDENILSIKNKIFLSMEKIEDKITFYPNFLKLELEKETIFILFTIMAKML